jgi:undecaprenyl-diphosphatase
LGGNSLDFASMQWLQQLDESLFRLINQEWSNPVLDKVMPWFSGNDLFIWLAVAVALTLIWKTGRKGVLCIAMLLVVVLCGDQFICFPLKKAIERDRPYVNIPETVIRKGRGKPNQSMPSSHTANWFAASTVLFLFYGRRAWPILIPAVIVSFSRIYNGAHHPGDVLFSAFLGAGYAVLFVLGMNSLWKIFGGRHFPKAFEQVPSLLHPYPPPRNTQVAT